MPPNKKPLNLAIQGFLGISELEGSGFKRVSMQDTVVQLVEREKDSRQSALKMINRGRNSPQFTAQEKEVQRLFRAAQRYEKTNPIR